MKHFGGPRELARNWHQSFTEATALKRVRAAVAMLRLLERFERHDVDPEELDDEELVQETLNAKIAATTELLKDRPEVVGIVAEQFGYRLTRIDDSLDGHEAVAGIAIQQ
ncbi:hypothetical protein GCM10023156_05060 [Novipirellula rosea]|uniref:Uncharacterized protein n=2 Tax=Novipirellula rosea TaxID=1031540 RepID=A0ABP8M9X2_9BACT